MDEVRLTWASRWYALRRSLLLGWWTLHPATQDPGGVFTHLLHSSNYRDFCTQRTPLRSRIRCPCPSFLSGRFPRCGFPFTLVSFISDRGNALVNCHCPCLP